MSKMLFPTILSTLLGISLGLGSFEIVNAAETPPQWVDALNCEPDLQKYDGLQYCKTKDDSAYVVVIDLFAENIGIEYVIAEGFDREGYYHECQDVNLPQWSTGPGCYASKSNPDYYPVMSLIDAARRYEGTAIVINSDYGAGDQGKPGEFRGHGPEGLTVIQGNRIDGQKFKDTDNNAEKRPWLAIGQSNPMRVEISQFSPGQDNGDAPAWIYTGVGGGPWLIKNGVVQTNVSNICDRDYPGSCYDGAAQTVVGISSDNRWLFFVIVLKSSKNLHEAIDILKSLDVTNAIKFDGGGSSQLYYGGFPGSSLEDKIVYSGDGRRLSQYLAIIAPPGNGISIENPPPGPTEEPTSLWDKIKKWWDDFWTGTTQKLNDWWEEQKKKLTDWLEAWWQEQLKKFEDWLNQQLVDLINQCCGSILLVPLVLTTVWISRRRKYKTR